MKILETLGAEIGEFQNLIRNSVDLPAGCQQRVTEAFRKLLRVAGLIEELKGPWRVSGKTEDGRMHCVSNCEGRLVAHIFVQDTAEALVELTTIV